MTTLVVAAYSPELEGLAELLPEAFARGRVVTRTLGVGLVEASAGAERVLTELTPSRVVLVGTAGQIPGSPLELGAVVVVSRAHLVLREPEYAPAPMPTRVDADSELALAFAKALGAPLVEAASTLGITLVDAEAERLGNGPAQVEQLECFALLSAAFRARVPATAVLAISNRVGSTGAAEWRAHHAQAETAAIAALAQALR
jgi:nucleoside phosphorylase